ncbi:hypothetical protein BH23VER1_BH23VER1_34750 [soil metagenome]
MNLDQPIPNEPTILQKGNLPPGRGRAAGPAEDRTGRRVMWASACVLAGIAGVGIAVKMGGLNKANAFLRGELAALAEAKTEFEEKAGFLASVRETLIKKLTAAEKKRGEVEVLASRLEEDKRLLGHEVGSLKSTVDVLTDKVASGRVTIASLEQDGREKQGAIDDLESVRDRLVVVNFDLKHELEEAKLMVAALSDENGELEMRLASLTKDFDQLTASMDSLTGENVALAHENLALQRQMVDLSYELEVKLAEIDLLRRSIRERETDEAVATARLNIFGGDSLAVPFVLD